MWDFSISLLTASLSVLRSSDYQEPSFSYISLNPFPLCFCLPCAVGTMIIFQYFQFKNSSKIYTLENAQAKKALRVF